MEIAQEAYLRFLSIPDFEKIADTESYLFSTAKNIHIDRVRNVRARANAIERGGFGVAYEGATTEVSCGGPEDEAAAKDMVRILNRAIESLPPKCQMAFVLYKFDLLGYPEIAERMGLTESMVRKYVLRALRDCQQSLGLQ
ncbi:MAG: RNA polymerase sigma factor [Rhodocyclaceae bacterium]|nr:MAG: RNA polymerase sigma factor [Rhodocyclaceae bacterium]